MINTLVVYLKKEQEIFVFASLFLGSAHETEVNVR